MPIQGAFIFTKLTTRIFLLATLSLLLVAGYSASQIFSDYSVEELQSSIWSLLNRKFSDSKALGVLQQTGDCAFFNESRTVAEVSFSKPILLKQGASLLCAFANPGVPIEFNAKPESSFILFREPRLPLGIELISGSMEIKSKKLGLSLRLPHISLLLTSKEESELMVIATQSSWELIGLHGALEIETSKKDGGDTPFIPISFSLRESSIFTIDGKKIAGTSKGLLMPTGLEISDRATL